MAFLAEMGPFLAEMDPFLVEMALSLLSPPEPTGIHRSPQELSPESTSAHRNPRESNGVSESFSEFQTKLLKLKNVLFVLKIKPLWNFKSFV